MASPLRNNKARETNKVIMNCFEKNYVNGINILNTFLLFKHNIYLQLNLKYEKYFKIKLHHNAVFPDVILVVCILIYLTFYNVMIYNQCKYTF